jgi:peptide/nickel transport system permease protein
VSTATEPITVRRRASARVLAHVPTRVAIVAVAIVLLIALVGPWIAPHDPTAILGAPVQGASSDFPLGTDLLGRDVLSRVLSGGRALLGFALIATILSYAIGAAIGLFAGFTRSRTGAVAMRGIELVLVFPPILFLMLLVSGAGQTLLAVTIGVVVLNVPQIARIIHSASLEAGLRGYVEAAVARGESTWYVLLHEILPSLTGTIAADAGPRFTVSMFLFASMNFLGLGVRPPTADWALMMTENRPAIEVQPLTVAVPVVLIAIITLGINVIADAVARAHGRTLDAEELARR